MKIISFLMMLVSFECFAGGAMDLKAFSQDLLNKMKDDIQPTPKLVNKKMIIRMGRNPASEAYDISKLKMQINDSSRYISKGGRPSLNAREVNPVYNNIKSFDYRNYYVNGTSPF